MALDKMPEKQLRERLRYLSDKMEQIWNKISPQLQEFDSLKEEFESILIELQDRGLLDGQTSTREDVGKNT